MLQWLHNHSQCFSSTAPCLAFHKRVQGSQSKVPVTRTAVLGDAEIPTSSQARSPQCSGSTHLCSIITSVLNCSSNCHPCCRRPGGVNRRRGRITPYPVQPHVLDWWPQRLNLLPAEWRGSGLTSQPLQSRGQPRFGWDSERRFCPVGWRGAGITASHKPPQPSKPRWFGLLLTLPTSVLLCKPRASTDSSALSRALTAESWKTSMQLISAPPTLKRWPKCF